MQLISMLSNVMSPSDSSEKIISILSIAAFTLSILLIINLLKIRKQKSIIKRLEDK